MVDLAVEDFRAVVVVFQDTLAVFVAEWMAGPVVEDTLVVFMVEGIIDLAV